MKQTCPMCETKTLKRWDPLKHSVVDDGGHYYYCNWCDKEVICSECFCSENTKLTESFRPIHNIEYHTPLDLV